jgi:hypothetical protein
MLGEISIKSVWSTEYEVKVTFLCDDRCTAGKLISDASSWTPPIRKSGQFCLKEPESLECGQAEPDRICEFASQIKWTDNLRHLIVAHKSSPTLSPFDSSYSDRDQIIRSDSTARYNPGISLQCRSNPGWLCLTCLPDFG